MKTAEEWAKEIKPGATRQIDLGNGQSVTGPGLMAQSVDPFSLVEIIRSAQRDAIEAAAKVAEDRANVSFPRPGAAVYYASIAEAGEIATAIRSLLPPDEASK